MDLGKIIGHGILSIGGGLFGVEALNVMKNYDELPTTTLTILKDYDLEVQETIYKSKAVVYLNEINSRKSPGIKEVIFNKPATIVKWTDGTKTVVKCQTGDEYNKETGLALCIAKKYLGNKGNFNEVFKKYITEES